MIQIDIPMPKTCEMCIFGRWYLYQTSGCSLTGAEQMFDEFSLEYLNRRSDKCPLKEINEQMMNDTIDKSQGEWIDKGWHGDWQFETDGRGNCWHEYECSECGFCSKGSKSNYCPNCGADMRGVDDE